MYIFTRICVCYWKPAETNRLANSQLQATVMRAKVDRYDSPKTTLFWLSISRGRRNCQLHALRIRPKGVQRKSVEVGPTGSVCVCVCMCVRFSLVYKFQIVRYSYYYNLTARSAIITKWSFIVRDNKRATFVFTRCLSIGNRRYSKPVWYPCTQVHTRWQLK